MLSLLVAVDRNLESSFALRTACFFGAETRIKPIHVQDPPDRDLTFGAGWARKSWGREFNKLAEEPIEELVLAERNQCPYIESPVIMTGDPVHDPLGLFWREDFDILIVGAPYRGWNLLTLGRKFRQAAKKEKKDLPLLLVQDLRQIHRVTALTDGGVLAEKGLGVLARISSVLTGEMAVIGLGRENRSSPQAEAMDLERGIAILKEKGLEPSGSRASDLGPDGILERLTRSDLVVGPFLGDEKRYRYMTEYFENNCRAALFYLGPEKE